MQHINNFKIKHKNGKYNSLDKAYNSLIIKALHNGNSEHAERWEAYNVIITELLKFGKEKYFEEIKYRFTDGEDSNLVILDILNREDEWPPLIWLLKKRVEGYAEEDQFKRFYE